MAIAGHPTIKSLDKILVRTIDKTKETSATAEIIPAFRQSAYDLSDCFLVQTSKNKIDTTSNKKGIIVASDLIPSIQARAAKTAIKTHQ